MGIYTTINPPYFVEHILYIQDFLNPIAHEGKVSYQFHAGGMEIYTEHKIIAAPFAPIRVNGRFYPNSSSIYTKIPQDIEIVKPPPKILANITSLRIKLTENILKLYKPDTAWNLIFSSAKFLLKGIYFYIDLISYETARGIHSIIFIQHKYLFAILWVLYFLGYYVMIKYSFFRKKVYYGRKNME